MPKKEKNKQDSLDIIIENTFSHIKEIVDANTVVGEIIDLGNKMYLIPVSKISVGLISGGGVLPKGKNNVNAGSGTGFNIVPIGFITISNLNFNFLPVNTASDISKSVLDGMFKLFENLVKTKEGENEEEQE